MNEHDPKPQADELNLDSTSKTIDHSAVHSDPQPPTSTIATPKPVEAVAPASPPEAPSPAEPLEANSVTLDEPLQSYESSDSAILAESRRYTRRSFAVAAASAAAGYGFYRWIDRSPEQGMQPSPLRRALLANAALARTLFRDHALAPTYPLSRAKDLRVNGIYGLKRSLIAESWCLQLIGMKDAAQHSHYTDDVTAWKYRYADTPTGEDAGHDTKIDPKTLSAQKMAPEPMQQKAAQDEQHTGRMPRGQEEAGESKSTVRPGTGGLLLTLDDVLKLPRHELVTQFKCIEGWSEIVHWAGVRMADFLEAYPPEKVDGTEPRYVYMETPDGDYYTGYDLHVLRHPQALLVTEMMGQPLTQFHGAPLRLHMPTKYGYKQIKRIALISYTNRKPDDYWTKLGYDWDAGL